MKLDITQLIAENPKEFGVFIAALGGMIIAAATQLNNKKQIGE